MLMKSLLIFPEENKRKQNGSNAGRDKTIKTPCPDNVALKINEICRSQKAGGDYQF